MVVLADLVRAVPVAVVLIEFAGCAGRVSVMAISEVFGKKPICSLDLKHDCKCRRTAAGHGLLLVKPMFSLQGKNVLPKK